MTTLTTKSRMSNKMTTTTTPTVKTNENHNPTTTQSQSRRASGEQSRRTSETASQMSMHSCSSQNSHSQSHHSFSGFSVYSADTNYKTVCESTVAKIFGTTKVKFHGRKKELDVLHGIYKEVCGGTRRRRTVHNESHNTGGNFNVANILLASANIPEAPMNTNYNNMQTQQHIDNKSTASTASTKTPSIVRSVALVSGISGSGKSALVQQFIEELNQQHIQQQHIQQQQQQIQQQQRDTINTSDTVVDNSIHATTSDKDKSAKRYANANTNANTNTNTNINATRKPLFLHGKFDELAGADPFSAMVEALTGLTTLLLGVQHEHETDGDPGTGNFNLAVQQNDYINHNEYAEDLLRIRRDVKAKLRQEDVDVLTAVVPALHRILSGSNSRRSTAEYTGSSNNTSQEEIAIANITIAESNNNTNNNNSTSNHNTSSDHFNSNQFNKTHNKSSSNNNNQWNRLKYVLQLFTRTIATSKRPVVMLLDDLQWADNGSLDLVQALVTDKRIRNFMFVGTYRSDAVDKDDQHPLRIKLSRISKTQHVETITLGNLTRPELMEFLHHHMSIQPSDCKRLAKKVHHVTNGNMFFVIQILVELNRECALIYSEFTKEWEWDDVAGMLVLETGLSDNLEEAVEQKIRRSTKLIKKALVTMAYSKGTMHIETLHKLMEKGDTKAGSKSRPLRRPYENTHLYRALDRAVLEGFLSNSIGSDYYSFAHDKVLHGSYALVKEGKARERFRLSMGKRLYKIGTSDANAEDTTWMLFAAAEHLNSSLSLTDSDPLFLASMNLEIGERASKVSAYDQASRCLLAGLDVLLMMPDQDPWIDHYDLTLRLHRAVADVELCRGRFDSGNEIGRRLLEKAKTLDDKLPTYEALGLALGREELHAEALVMNRDALQQLGEYPKHNRVFVLLKELMTVRRYLKKMSDADMMKIQNMTDQSKEIALAFAEGLAIQAFYCDNLVEFLLGTVRALQITFQNGLSGYSSMAIISYGIILSGMNDHAGALRAASLARNIMTICDTQSEESVFFFCTAHFIEAWVDPHEKTLENHRQGHLMGMEAGDVENAFLNSWGAVHHARSAGCPLGSIEVISRELTDQMDLYNVKSVLVMHEQSHLPVHYLTGTHYKGIEPPWEELCIEPKGNGSKLTGSENLRLLFWHIARVELGVYFGNFEFADQMAKKLRSVLPRHTAYISLSFRLFYSGLAASGMARRMRVAGKRMQARRYRAKAKRLAMKLAHYNTANGPNNHHRELLMLADLNLSDGKDPKPVSYDRAISACLEVGHIHDAALAAELAGEHFVTKIDSKQGTGHAETVRKKLIQRYFTRARDLYNSWGAYAKVEQLHKRRGDYIEGSNTQAKNGGIISIELENDIASCSSENDFSQNSSGNGFSIHSSPPVLYNPRLLGLLAGIVPSSETTGILSPMSDRQLNEEEIGNDESSIVSDIDFEA